MTTSVMSTDDQLPAQTRDSDSPVIDPEANADPAVQRIIDRARSIPVQAPARGAWQMAGLTALTMWAAFTPLEWSPLGWLSLIPLILLIRVRQPVRRMYWAVYGGGLVWALASLQWMRLGHPTMYIALLALSVYVAVYLPLFVAIARVGVHRLHVPVALAVPLSWVGLEFVRAHAVTGFSWYYLGHTQYRWTDLIQISDLVGAYGVSFLVAMISAVVAMLVPLAVFDRLKLVPPETTSAGVRTIVCAARPRLLVALCLFVWLAVLGYGFARRSEAEFEAGPRVALVQGNFTSTVKHNPNSWRDMLERHDRLTTRAVQEQPDLIVWPETMFPFPMFEVADELTDERLLSLRPDIPEFRARPDLWLNQWRDPQARNRLESDSRRTNAGLLIGIEANVADESGYRQYNSSAFFRPELGYQGRYDKVHRVIFGEYIPLKDTFPWLARFSPYGSAFEINAGTKAVTFEYAGWRFAPIICFEDTVPHLVRELAASASRNHADAIDFFVNQTNDGWFHGSSELDQHLITAAFRCVECRTPMVRAVNTGVSAFIDGNGVVRSPDVFYDADAGHRSSFVDDSGSWRKQLNAVLVDHVPLDSRGSLYVRCGDWFAGTCCFFCLFAALSGPLLGRRRHVPRA